jgi:transglutaminase-like putative cysteine protease
MSRKVLFSLIIFSTLVLQAPRARAVDWDPVTDAEKSMKSNPLDPGAGAVVLFKRGNMEVIERSSLFWTIRIQSYVRIKVFTDAGRDAANVSVEHFKRFRLSKVEGQTTLPTGEVIPLDSSKIFQGTVYQEGKHFALLATNFTLPSVTPGSIIEYQTEEYVDGFFPPTWIFDTREIGTLESTLRVTIGPRLGMSQFPLETTQSKISVSQANTVKGAQLDFSVKNLRPIQDEPFSPPFRDQAAMVLFTPTQLGFGGNVYPLITKWDDVAEEIKRELGNMEKVDKDLRNKARELADKLPDPQKKAQAIFSYLQQNITSSNIAGIGLGRPADEILGMKRGDPDEINAVYILMLREVKVDADMVLVCTQNWDTLVRGFPNFNQFSRIITRLNFKDGPVFADPADAAAPFGEIPWFERGLQALAVKGSKIQEVDIPAGTVDDNVSTTKIAMQIGKDWSTEGDEEIDLKGTEAIEFRADLMDQSPEKLEQRLADYFGYGHSDAEVTTLTHPEFRDSSQPFVIKAHLKDRLTNEAGPSTLLLNPWMDDQFERPLFKTTVRHSAVKFDSPERRVSTSSWQIPPEIKVDQLPKDVKIDNDLGGFSHTCSQSGATITCTRIYYLKKMMLRTNIEYLNAKKFFEDIAKQDQEVIVLRQQ